MTLRQHGMRTLLLVDDDVRIVRSLGRLFALRGFEVSTALGVDEAEAILRQKPIDVVLTDLQMPGRTGLDLLRLLPEVAPAARAVLMTGVSFHPDVQRAMELGAIGVLEKPFDVDRLRELLDGRRDDGAG
jgi:two-component system response regulator YesN